MSIRPKLLLLLMGAAGGLAATLGAASLARAEAQADGAIHQLNTIAQDAQEVLNLRARHEVVALSQRPKEDVYAQISRVLLDSGIPSSALRDVAPEGDRPVEGAASSGVALRTQSMRFSLEPVTPSQLGGFLSRWSSQQPAWRVAGIELVHLQSKTDDSYTCRLTVTATYLASP